MYHTEFIDQDAIPSVISALKGVPNVNLTWFGNQLSIQSQDPANALKVADQIKLGLTHRGGSGNLNNTYK